MGSKKRLELELEQDEHPSPLICQKEFGPNQLYSFFILPNAITWRDQINNPPPKNGKSSCFEQILHPKKRTVDEGKLIVSLGGLVGECFVNIWKNEFTGFRTVNFGFN